jgi:hypothetical protein
VLVEPGREGVFRSLVSLHRDPALHRFCKTSSAREHALSHPMPCSGQPQGPALYGSLDQTLRYQRRFSKAEFRELFAKHGFAVERMSQLNKIGTLGWWLYGKVLRRGHISKVMLKIFDKTGLVLASSGWPDALAGIVTGGRGQEIGRSVSLRLRSWPAGGLPCGC